jgi:hypothetical protein
MTLGNLSGDDFLKKLREIIKKSSIESSKNHRFWDFPSKQFPGMLPKIIKQLSLFITSQKSYPESS